MSGYRFDRLKILTVDDNVHMRRLVSTILQAFGVVDIREACNAKQAWTPYLGGARSITIDKVAGTFANSTVDCGAIVVRS